MGQVLAGCCGSAGPTVAGLLGRGVHHLPSSQALGQVQAQHPHLVPHVVVPEQTAASGPRRLPPPRVSMETNQMESLVLLRSGVPSGLKIRSVFRLPVLS